MDAKLSLRLATADDIDFVTAVIDTVSFPDALWVNTLWTDASVRGRGLGQLMIRAAESRAREAGLKCLALNCWADNSRGRDFHAKAGFTEKGRIPLAGKVVERHLAGGILFVKPLGVAA